MLYEALRLVRVFHDINQSQLADKLGISRSYLSEIESGKKTPSIELIDKYGNVFNLPPSSLLYFSEQLADNKFAEKARVSIAKKIVKIMNWVSETETIRDAITNKST
jgi:transcriptional regulator with XRE-family HTH domain